MSSFAEITADRPLLLIGGGKMGGALLAGWLEGGLSPAAVVVADPTDAIRSAYQAKGIRTAAGPDELSGGFSCAMFATKPQVMGAVLNDYASKLDDCPLGLSIAAGLPVAYFDKSLPDSLTTVRAMPNTPAAVGAGISALFAPASVSAQQRKLCEQLMTAVGPVLWLDDEAQMDAVTAVSGSGPAYLFHMIECMTQAGIAEGLSAEQATKLATHTVFGAGKLAVESDEPAAQLRINVTSPKGTTEAGLNQLMRDPNGLQSLVNDTVKAAAARSRELSRL